MSITVTIRDEVTGASANEFELALPAERITVRELIRSRVYQQVKDHNIRRPQVYSGQVQPTEDELALNGPECRKTRQVDWRRPFDAAIEAFTRREVVVLVDDRQVDDLDQELVIGTGTYVTFLRLVPLAGG